MCVTLTRERDLEWVTGGAYAGGTTEGIGFVVCGPRTAIIMWIMGKTGVKDMGTHSRRRNNGILTWQEGYK